MSESPSGSSPDPLVWPAADRSFRLLRLLTTLYAATAAVLLLGGWAIRRLALPAEALRSGALGSAAGAVLIALAGLAATWLMAWARYRVVTPSPPRAAVQPRWWHRALRRAPAARAPVPPALRLARMARRPQGMVVPLLALGAASAAWLLRPTSMVPPSAAPEIGTWLGAGLILLAFPLLVAERVVAATPEARLPEASALRALLFVPVIVWPVLGCLELAAGMGIGAARIAGIGVAFYLVLVAAELGLRALAQWFLPPPEPARARACIDSIAGRLLRPRSVAPDGFAAPIRAHLGIDFSRSWALRYLRAAALPVLALILLFCWGLSGVGLVDLDQRGIYERFGRPVAVLQPGLHLVLPWPLGKIRRTELGVVHAVPLGAGGAMLREARTAAEDAPPASADRLWESTHPAEASYVIASEASGRQSFQIVSVDVRVLFRIGPDDHAALRAAYGEANPEALVRSEAGRLVARFFAVHTLPGVMGARRERMAGELRASLQAVLDRLDSGIELLDVVIEAIHPPIGAAEAYHYVQAAGIIATTRIATERGQALATGSLSLQNARQMVDRARAVAAETVGGAEIDATHFAADHLAAEAGGQAFRLERYFANLSQALAKSPLVIVDHRLQAADAPTIDLRNFADPRAGTGDPD